MKAGLGEQQGEKLLCKKEITDRIESIASARKKALANMATTGYYKLAFGSIADAVSLLYADNPTKEELSKMDLFSVSEIKRPKDGSMEIKFFDRLKAIEHLEKETEEESTARDFFDAIGKSADGCGDVLEN